MVRLSSDISWHVTDTTLCGASVSMAAFLATCAAKLPSATRATGNICFLHVIKCLGTSFDGRLVALGRIIQSLKPSTRLFRYPWKQHSPYSINLGGLQRSEKTNTRRANDWCEHLFSACEMPLFSTGCGISVGVLRIQHMTSHGFRRSLAIEAVPASVEILPCSGGFRRLCVLHEVLLP